MSKQYRARRACAAPSRRSSCSAWARPGAPRSPARCRTRPASRVFQVFRLEPRPARARPRRRYRAEHARPPFPGALHLWESEYLLRHPPSAGRAVDGDHDGARADRPGGLGVLPRRRPARACRAATPRPTTLADDAASPSGWVRDAAALVRPRVRARARHRRVRARRSIPTLGHARDRDAGGAGAAAPPGEPRRARPRRSARFLGRPAPVPVPARNEATAKEYAGPVPRVPRRGPVARAGARSGLRRPVTPGTSMPIVSWSGSGGGGPKGPKRPRARAERIAAESRSGASGPIRPGYDVRRREGAGMDDSDKDAPEASGRGRAAPDADRWHGQGSRGRSRPTRR